MFILKCKGSIFFLKTRITRLNGRLLPSLLFSLCYKNRGSSMRQCRLDETVHISSGRQFRWVLRWSQEKHLTYQLEMTRSLVGNHKRRDMAVSLVGLCVGTLFGGSESVVHRAGEVLGHLGSKPRRI